MYSRASTNNPLGQRPMSVLATLNGEQERMVGLGAIVPSGALLSYVGVWTTTWTMRADEVVSAVTARLANDGLLVKQVSIEKGLLSDVLITGQQFTVRLTIQVGGPGYGDVNDAISIVRHEVYQATGLFPQSDSISQVTTAAGTQQTGQPGVTAPVNPDSWSAWAKDNAGLIGVGIAATLIGVVLVKGR